MARRLRPRSATLKACLAKHEQQAQDGDLQAVWKRFRASPCGQSWFAKLETSYGRRCMYCDHAPGRTIDHCKAKSKDSASMFRWSNWRVSCDGCNRLKNSRSLPDPVRGDPRDFILFDVSTGSPGVNPAIPSSNKGRKRRAEVAVRILDHQTDAQASAGESPPVSEPMSHRERVLAG
ncbi:HNH endonuclease [Chondromyces apiculatus]|uniref:HNH endonuclease n=1 Tax=Chondromyces apiculatus TaxID=51 RepID=UPI0018CC701F